MKLLRIVAVAVLALAPSVVGQSLTTTYASNNGFAGVMFDITAIQPIIVTGFDTNLAVGTHTIEIWTITSGGSYVGSNLSNANWTQIAVVPNVVSTAQNAPTNIPVILSVQINPGQSLGFYITTQGTSMRYTNGVGQGLVYVQDANIQIHEGHAGGYPFNLTNVPRVFNGTVYYQPAENILSATTTGGGTGDFNITLSMISPNAYEGYILVTSQTLGQLGFGPMFGIWPDSLTFSEVGVPMAPNNPIHFPIGIPGVFPDTTFTVGPGILSFLAGQTWDAVAVIFGYNYQFLGRSNVNRIVW